jgi:hypothetical protein
MVRCRLSVPRRFAVGAVLAMVTCIAAGKLSSAAASDGEYRMSFLAGGHDDAGRHMGGTELRVLATHGGRLFAGNGYWEDRPGPEGLQGAQILVLDGPTGHWRVDHGFDDRQPNGRIRDLAVSALSEAVFTTDANGVRLSAPLSMLIASTWDVSGATRVFSRNDTTGDWTAMTLARDRPARDFLPQVRSFGTHRDRITGADLVFAGQNPRGIHRGGYDATAAGRIRWSEQPELDISQIPTAAFPGLAGRLRVNAFVECNNRLYAAVGQQIFERVDGPQASWRPVYTTPHPAHSETGLRGLTAITGATGSQVMLAAIEGVNARIIQVDPRTGSETTDLDLGEFLGRVWQTRLGYLIAAYNDMTVVHDSRNRELLLIGLEAFIPPLSAVPSGHAVHDVGYGRVEAGAWYLVRYPDRHYQLREITLSDERHQPLVATRAIRVSPFPNDAAALYFAGYDANKAAAHDTAWVVRGTVNDAIGASH